MDNVSDKAKDMMNDPEKKKKIEQLAKDKGMSMDQAKEHFAKHNNND